MEQNKDLDFVTDYDLGYEENDETNHNPCDDPDYADDYMDWELTKGDE